MRTGQDYLAAIKDDRAVHVDGRRVPDVVSHPGFAPIAATVAELFDLALDDRSGMTVTAPETGAVTNRVYGIPRSRDDLTALRHAVETWARHTHGWVGRGPDHVAAFLNGFAAHPEVFATAAGRDLAENVVAYHRLVQAESLYVTYALIPPPAARHDPGVQVAVVAERSDGIVVRGAQMLVTAGAVADEILVSCIRPLAADDADRALSFAVPVATDGLRLHCRRPYAPVAGSRFDYPLTSRFDETDALLVFDDVVVPWHRVFVHRDVARVRRQFFDTGAHVLGNWQAQIRFAVKLRFLAGLARKTAAVNKVDAAPGVVEELGELAGIAAGAESAVLAAEYTAAPDEAGLWLPGRRALYGAMALQAVLYPRALAILRSMAGGGVLALPSGVADLSDPAIRSDIDRCVGGPDAPAEERIKLFKLVWDAVGSEFAGRHHQYEMFYAGSPAVVKGYAFRNYGFDTAVAEVDRFLACYGPE